MSDQQQPQQHRDSTERRSSFVQSLLEAQASLEAAQADRRRGGAAAVSGAHHRVGAAGAALEVLDSLSRDRVTHEDDDLDETAADDYDGGGGGGRGDATTDVPRRRSTATNDLLAQIAAAENGGGGGGGGGPSSGAGEPRARQMPVHMDSAASESTGVLLARVDDLWGPGRDGNGRPSAAAAAAASDAGPLGGIAPPPPHPDADVTRTGGRGGNDRSSGIGRGYSEAVLRPDTDEQQVREQYRIMALNEARRQAAMMQEQQQQQIPSEGGRADDANILVEEIIMDADADQGGGGGVGRIPRRTPPTRPPPPKPRRGRPPPPPGPIEPPMPPPRKGTASIDDKYTAAWRAVPDLCTGEVVKLRRQENSDGNAPRDANDGVNLPAAVLIERAVGVGDDEHLVRCLNCTRGLRVHKMASLVRCKVCASVSPATSLR